MEIGYAVKSIFKKHLGIELNYLGFLEYDNSVWQSVRKKRPLVLEYPNAQLVTSLERITRSMMLEKKNG